MYVKQTTKMPLPNNPAYHLAKSIHEFRVIDLNGEHVELKAYKDHVCIIVNTATKSHLTDTHYKQFNKLMEKYGESSKGLRILAFPCNQFGHEEPCTSEEIAKHAKAYNVKFDVYAKVNVNCIDAIPLYKFLKRRLCGQFGCMVKWNYTKFLVNKQGIPVERFGPDIFPEDLEKTLQFYCNEENIE